MEGDRIEIELVPNDGTRRTTITSPRPVADRSAFGEVLEAETTDGPGSGDGAGGDRRRTVAIAAGVGLVALLFGWTVGRAGDSSDTATAPASTVDVTTPRTTAADQADDVEPRDTIEPVDEPADEARPPLVSWPPVSRQQNATDLVENGATIDTVDVVVDDRLDGQDLVLVGLVGSDVAELDLAAATVTGYELDGLPRDHGPTIVAGDDWIVVPMYNGLDPFVVYDDGSVGRSDLTPDGNQMLHVDGTDRFWRMPRVWDGLGLELEQVDLEGQPTGATIELPPNVWPAFADPRGGVVVQASGRWFSVDAEESTAIGTGEVVALDGDHVLLYDCRELDDCALWRLQRDTGVVTEVPFDLDRLESRFLPASWWSGDAGAGLSPDGRRFAATIEGDGSARSVVIDLMTGAIIDLEGVRPGPPSFVWTDDGRYLVYLGILGEPTGYSMETGESFPVVADDRLSGWNLITHRP